MWRNYDDKWARHLSSKHVFTQDRKIQLWGNLQTLHYFDVFGRLKGKTRVWIRVQMPWKGVDVHAFTGPRKGFNQGLEMEIQKDLTGAVKITPSRSCRSELVREAIAYKAHSALAHRQKHL